MPLNTTPPVASESPSRSPELVCTATGAALADRRLAKTLTMRKTANARSHRMLVVRGGLIFTLDLPVRILAKPAVGPDEALGCLRVALELPVEPTHRHRGLAAPIGIQECSAMADIEIGDEYRHRADAFKIIHPIGISDIARSAKNVDDGRVQLLQCRLGDGDSRNGIGIGEDAAAMDQDGALPRIGGNLG